MIAQRRKSLERFIDLVAETHRGCKGLLGTAPTQRFAVTVVVGAISSMVTNAVGSGDVDSLMKLREPLLAFAKQLSEQSPGGTAG